MNKEQMNKLADLYANSQISFYHTLCQDEFKQGFRSAEEIYQKQISDLKSIIAKELSENDEFGCEFVIKNILDDKIKILKSAILKVIEMNYQQAEDCYGDRSKADKWGCVVTLKKALGEIE